MTFGEPASEWLILDATPSTQDIAADRFLRGIPVRHVVAWHQTAGKGRLDRRWLTGPKEALTMSLTFVKVPPEPWLLGMKLAVAAAEALGCKVRWPNDLTFDGLKVGGILTEMAVDEQGNRAAIVGIGVNVSQTTFPAEIAPLATSLLLQGRSITTEDVAVRILTALAALEEIRSWHDLDPLWRRHDDTPGKLYKHPEGSLLTAIEVASDGSLLAIGEHGPQVVLAAEAVFGRPA